MSFLIKASPAVAIMPSSSSSSSSRRLFSSIHNTIKIQSRNKTTTPSTTNSSSSITTSSSSTSARMTTAERNQALRDANEKMKYYHYNRPSLKVLNKKKVKFGDDNRHFILAGTISTFLCLFLYTPFLGKKIARDDEFRQKYIPKFYDYSVEKPDYAWTRAELHEQMVQLQVDLHKRAINGDFTPEKLEEMRRKFDGNNSSTVEGGGDDDGDNDQDDIQAQVHGWDKLHPGVDDDEDIEED